MSLPAGRTYGRCRTLCFAFSVLLIVEAVCLGLLADRPRRHHNTGSVSTTSHAAQRTTGLRVEALAIGIIPAVLDAPTDSSAP